MEEKVRPNVKTSWIEKPVSPDIHETSNVDPMATVIGDVTIKERVNIAPGAVIRGDEGTPIFIGNDSNIQDNVIIHSLKGKGVWIGERVSLAHGSIIHGPVKIVPENLSEFASEVIEVNRELASGYLEFGQKHQRSKQNGREFWQWLYDSLTI